MLINFIFGLIGLIIGSFLNVVIYRLPREESIVFPASHCPECGHQLSALELIPVISYIILRGRCRECGASISLKYPLVELLTAFLFLINSLVFSSAVNLIAGLLLSSLLIALAMIDIQHQILPDRLTLTGLAAGLLISFIRPEFSPLEAVAGVLAGGGLLLIIAVISKGGLGGGDIKLMMMVGSFVGPIQVLVAIFLGAILGLLTSLPGIISGSLKLKSRLPFGPFLGLASVIIWLTGSWILNIYLSLIL